MAARPRRDARDGNGLRAGQRKATPLAFLAFWPTANAVVFGALRFLLQHDAFARVTNALATLAGGVQKVPLLVAMALYLLTWATFLACQLHCATHGFLDNRNRRELFESWGPGLGSRAWSAHKNALEALGGYAPAAVAALTLSAPALPAATLASVVLLARLAHWACYLAALDAPRSMAYGAGAHATLFLYALCLWPIGTVRVLGLT